MTVGERIADRRKQLGMTQEELAFKLGYKSRSSINKIELEWSNVPLSKLVRVAEALDCEPSYLMGWEDEEEQLPTLGELSTEESELILLFRKVPEADRRKVLGMIQVALGNL